MNPRDEDNSPPDFAKDIKSGNSNISVPMEFNVETPNPYTLSADDTKSYGISNIGEGEKQKSSFLDTYGAEFYDWNYTIQGSHAAYSYLSKPDPLLDIVSPGWTPTTDSYKYASIQDKNINYVLQATGPKDQDYRIQRALSEQAHDETLANGSFLAKLLGGVSGAILDPMNLIPIAGWVKYAKLSTTILKTAARVLPGATTYGVLSAGAEQADKINGNLANFITDAMVRTVFGTVLFTAGGALGNIADRMKVWELKDHALNYMNGIDFKLATNEKGIINGIKVYDNTGGLSAQKVSFAQDLANSSFHNGGLFSIPYVGTAAKKLAELKIPGTDIYFGSTLMGLLNSPFKSVRGIIDRIVDHSIITKGIAEGEAAPKKFASLMNQSSAEVRALSDQLHALHMERNGFKSDNRVTRRIAGAYQYLKDKSVEMVAQNAEKNEYTDRPTFDDEVQQVLTSKVNSSHPSVNDAANLVRPHLDTLYKNYRIAYNLPEDWMPPKTAAGYLMRVYNTPFMNTNENLWTQVISDWLKESDEMIKSHMQPISSIESIIKKTKNPEEIFALKARKKALEEKLQNELRSNPNLHIHVEDWNGLSADEANKIQDITKYQRDISKEIEDQKKIISNLKSNKDKKPEKAKLAELEKNYQEELERLQLMMHNGGINSRLFYKEKDSFIYKFKDPEDRLKFREVYKSHTDRKTHAKAYYDTIMNQRPEDTINQIMGRFTGNTSENHLKQRTLLVPDEILYQNGFLTKDLMAKVSNYSTYLARRTHLKTVFNDVTVNGGFEPILNEVHLEHEGYRDILNKRKEELIGNLKKENISAEQKKTLEKQISSVDKELISKKKEFESAKKSLNNLYEKMMGIKKYEKGAEQARSIIMSLTAIANLPFVPFTMLNDLSTIGLKHGIWPFIRDGIYPVIESIGALMKTKDSRALRKTAPSVHLGLQDILNGYADKNWGAQNNPYLNLGKWVHGLEKLAHLNSNFTLTNYFDNALQHISGAVAQSELMRILHAYKAGNMTKKEGIYIRKYGLDPKIWADRMIEAFNEKGGGKTKLGGYQSNFWHWEDMEASNEFGSAVFRGIKDTTIQAGIADSPFWTDSILGSIVKGFSGWTYASVNRYVIPTMQQPDSQLLLNTLLMVGVGALVDPIRRVARGEEAWPQNMTTEQHLYSAVSNSGYFSGFASVLSTANLLTGDRLLGNLKNDKYKDRSRIGLLGPAFGTVNRMADIITALGSGEMNKADALKFARMVPFANATWTYWMSKKLVEGLDIPDTRRQAHALKEINQ